MITSATFTGNRALTFANGLFHVAACDGITPEERAALDLFLKQLNLSTAELEALNAPFIPEQAAQIFGTTWMRRTFIKACQIVVQLDGTVSEAERDLLRRYAIAMGIGEAIALADLEGPVPAPEHLYRWLDQLAIDFVSWDDELHSGWLWSFPHERHPLAEGATLRVEPGQALAFRSDVGLDVLGPGDHEARPETLPKLAEAHGWRGGGSVLARPLFFRTAPSPILRWGTLEPVRIQSPRFGAIELQAFGRFSVRVIDPAQFAQRFLTQPLPTEAEMDLRVRRIFSGRFAQVLRQQCQQEGETCLNLAHDLDALRDATLPSLSALLAASGLEPVRFKIENLSLPEALAQQLRARKIPPPAPRETRESSIAPFVRLDEASPHTCAHCEHAIPADARFCDNCGTAQRRPCSYCGHSLPLRARFCSHCGQPQLGT